ncbi:MAG: class I tRNA ligase family protein, partial [Solirubrobacterales bacterium]
DFSRDFQFNTVIAAVMELVNEAYRLRGELEGSESGLAVLRYSVATAASLIQPFAPHLAAEVWGMLVGGQVWSEPWPEADPELLTSDTVEIVVQVNGKVRDRIEVAEGAGEEEVLALARSAGNAAKHLEEGEVVKEVFVPGRLVNFVVRGA